MKQFTRNNKTFYVCEPIDDEWMNPDDSYVIVLSTDDYTESDAALIVEKFDEESEYWYKNYLNENEKFLGDRAVQSFQSLMESIGCPIVNKFGEVAPNYDVSKGHGSVYEYLDWKSEQDKIKVFLILEKI